MGDDRHTAYYKDGKYVSAKAAAIVDNCDAQAFSPLEVETPKPTPAPSSPKSKKRPQRGSS